MTDLCKIENGLVVNRAHFDGPVPHDWVPPGETWIESETSQIGWSYSSGVFSPPPAPPAAPITGDDVSVERERRLSLGCTVTLASGQGPIPVQTRDEVDHRNLLTLESQAIKAVIGGAPNTPFAFRDAHDKTWTLTALEMMDMTAKVAAFGAGIFAKSWALKAMSPIPATYQSDEWWT